MTGDCAETWCEEVKERIRNYNVSNAAVQRRKFKETIQKFNKIYLGEDVIDKQKKAMEEGTIKYAGCDIEKVVKCLYAINDTLPLLAKGTTKFSDRDMAKKIITRNLNAKAKAKFIVNGGDRLHKNQTSWLSVNKSRNSSTSSQKPNKRNDRKDTIGVSTMAIPQQQKHDQHKSK